MQASTEYDVILYTSDVRGAGTDGEVYAVLEGAQVRAGQDRAAHTSKTSTCTRAQPTAAHTRKHACPCPLAQGASEERYLAASGDASTSGRLFERGSKSACSLSSHSLGALKALKLRLVGGAKGWCLGGLGARGIVG